MTDSNFAADRPPKLATKATHLGNNDDISDKEVEILNNIYKKISKSIDNISSLTPSNGVENEEVDDQSNNDDWTVNPIMQKENIMKGKDISENKAKFKKTRNKKACDVCKKKKIKCIYNFDDDRTDMNDERLYEDTVIPSNKQYLGIVCVYCKRNNTKCTFLAPERKRGYKKLSDEEERQLKETPAPKKKKIKEEVRETSIEHDEVDAVKKKAVKLSNAERLKKYDALFDSIFNSNAKQDEKLKIDSFDSELFKKIYEKINQHDTSLNNYEFDGSRNNMINNNYFQIAIDRYEYFLQNKLAGSSGLQFFSLQVPLPSKERAIELIENAWLESFVVFRFYHRPTFIENLNRLYSLKPHEYDEKLIKFLPSLYSVMAVGSLFDTKADDDFLKKSKNLDDDDEGYRFFLAARNMIDLGSCTDINSIQTTVMLFMFLQCSARLSTCYIYIGVAMRSALREGYHRFIAEGTPGYSLLDIEMRKRTFFTIYKMDIYVNNMLGLPKAISFMDFDQTLPLEYEDEYITHEGLKLPRDYDPNNNITSVTISNHHTKLLMILEEVVEKLYPVKKTNNVIPHKVVTELEVRLDSWVRQLPKYLVPGIDEKEIPNDFLFKANRLLHFSYLQVQIVLYRPFIHYLILDKNQSLQYDELSIKRGEMCKNVAKKAILLAKEMLQKKLLNGNHWFSIYTIFFSVAGLLFYVHESTPDTTNAEEMAEYNECNELCIFAKTILDSLKGSSKAANRTYNVLNALFDSLNKRTKMYMELSFKKNRNPQATTGGRNDKKNEKNEFENAQKNIGTPLTDTISMFMQAVAAEHSVPHDYPSEVGNFATDNNAQRQQFINQAMMSPIDDEAFFGIDTPNSINSYYGSNNLPVMNNGNGYGPHMFATVSGSNLPLPVIQEQKNSDVSGRKKEDLPFDIVKEEQSPMFMMKNPEDNAKKDEETPDTTYISGVFDQLDMQLFGRYLPPYMTRNVNNNKK